MYIVLSYTVVLSQYIITIKCHNNHIFLHVGLLTNKYFVMTDLNSLYTPVVCFGIDYMT